LTTQAAERAYLMTKSRRLSRESEAWSRLLHTQLLPSLGMPAYLHQRVALDLSALPRLQQPVIRSEEELEWDSMMGMAGEVEDSHGHRHGGCSGMILGDGMVKPGGGVGGFSFSSSGSGSGYGHKQEGRKVEEGEEEGYGYGYGYGHGKGSSMGMGAGVWYADPSGSDAPGMMVSLGVAWLGVAWLVS
jgi:hypothetical protein